MTIFTMNTSSRLMALLLAMLAAAPLSLFQSTTAQHIDAPPTPTQDPFDEPPLPPNPTEYELGRNLYWHWCMTCHGDRGQGLTDEFRRAWDPEHQNCWGRGCHAGHPGDMGFPIPTVVPALVSQSHLARFASVEELADFLQATHPPQSPGILKRKEYHAIAVFVLTPNNWQQVSPAGTAIPASTPTSLPEPLQQPGFPTCWTGIVLLQVGS